MATMIENAMDKFIRKTFYNSQNDTCCVVYNVVEQLVLDLLRGSFFIETLDAHIPKFFDRDETTEAFPKRQLTSTFYGAYCNFS